MKKYNTFVWSSDYEAFTGEGLLARCFVENYFKSEEIIKIYSNNNKYLFQKNKYFLLKKKNYKNNFLTKYLYPFYGVLLIWHNHIKGKKTCYVNYLPLWNFLIFIFLPRSTILGPVTGSIYSCKIYNFNTFFRKVFFQFFYFISLKIVFLKYKYVIFSTENLKKIIPKDKIKFCLFNFCLLVYRKRKLKKKNIDFLFYIRKHPQKSNFFLNYIIKKLTFLNLKIVIVGDKFNEPNIENYENVDRNKLLPLLDRTKYSVMSGENFYSLFFLDCISANVFTFFNKKLKPNKVFFKNSSLQSLNYNSYYPSFLKINNKLNKKKNKMHFNEKYFLVEKKNILNFLKNSY
jgi:hypothetical protein